jgi:hypothetical protein
MAQRDDKEQPGTSISNRVDSSTKPCGTFRGVVAALPGDLAGPFVGVFCI